MNAPIIKMFGKCPSCNGLMAGAGEAKEQLEAGESICDRCGWIGAGKDLVSVQFLEPKA